jgi:hypothetical protein
VQYFNTDLGDREKRIPFEIPENPEIVPSSFLLTDDGLVIYVKYYLKAKLIAWDNRGEIMNKHIFHIKDKISPEQRPVLDEYSAPPPELADHKLL